MLKTLQTTAFAVAATIAVAGAANATVLDFSDITPTGVSSSPQTYVSNGVTFDVTSDTGNVGVYDTTVAGEDPDLTSPFVDADGLLPATGFGNAIVANENNSTPDDQAGGADLFFEFVSPILLSYIDILDAEEGAEIFVNGSSVGSAMTPGTGQPDTVNYFDRVSFADTLVSNIRVVFSGSGAVGEIGLAPIPVPAALPLLIGGLGALGVARRRRKTA
ncbi:MAG: VPLPA-CTERM sorting domain-containing protein [Pseudomonadota bacterium]